jgi:DNA-directed RNA polymerase specialized sigma24 family protein
LALRLLRFRPKPRIAVHETFLVALHCLDDLRGPEAVSGCPHAVLRNRCLCRVRRQKSEVLSHNLSEAEDEATPQERIERLALRNWM